jgi:hypothetical protein
MAYPSQQNGKARESHKKSKVASSCNQKISNVINQGLHAHLSVELIVGDGKLKHILIDVHHVADILYPSKLAEVFNDMTVALCDTRKRTKRVNIIYKVKNVAAKQFKIFARVSFICAMRQI